MAIPVHIKLDGVWVAESGEYGAGDFVVLNANQITVKQLEFLAELPESERFAYAADVASGADLTGWEIQYARG